MNPTILLDLEASVGVTARVSHVSLSTQAHELGYNSSQKQESQKQGYQHIGPVELNVVIYSLWRLDTALRT